ncbi:UNVERIFIED_CONTAM: hypothetical protein FKN15_074191 [Acipenser sinensis]
MLDFHEQPVGMPKMEKVYLHNPSSEETIILVSISATTSHFHASFFQNRIIPPGGNTSFDVVFLARVVGNVENTLFINTSHHGVFTYQVFGVGIPNPYRLRPFIGARVPVNSSFSPLINIHNPHSEPLQEIPPFETKGVMRASFSSRDADNHTAFIRIKTNASDDAEFIILPVEVEVTTDQPKVLNLHLLNSGTKDVPITSVRPTPSNEAITIDFKPITLKAGESKYTKVASISFDASKAKRSAQFSGKITVKAKEKSYSKLEIPYQADVLEGYLGFDHTATLFHIRDSPTDPVERAVYLTNTFNFAIRIHNVSLPEEAKSMFSVLNFSAPILVPPHESRYIFSLHFTPARPSIHIDSNILLITNASKFHLPPFVLPPSLEERFLDFSVLSVTESSSILFAVINSNPIELAVKSWHVIGDSLTIELLKSDKGNKTTVLDRIQQLQNSTLSDQTTVILASGYYAVFRVTLTAKELEGTYDGAIQITTDYEILTVPVKAVVAVGTLTSSPKHIVLPTSFPGKVVHQSFNIQSSFSQKVKLQHIRSVTEDVRFYYKRLKSNKDDLEPRRKSKVANIYFDARLQCGDHCYAGLPFLSKGESKPHGLVMQQDLWDADMDLHQTFHKRWRELKENSGHEAHAVFEVDTDLQKNVDARVTAQMIWPSIINTPRQIMFPLTNTNSSSGEEVVLSNPADVPVFVQVLPLSLYPSPSAVAEQLAQRLNLGKFTNLDPKTLQFQVHRNQTSSVKSSSGFVEGPSRPSVYNMILQPGEMKSFTVKFTPLHNKTVSAFIIVRNNLTVLDSVVVRGQGTTESLKVAGKPPGSGSYLRFKMTESLLKDCSDNFKQNTESHAVNIPTENTKSHAVDIPTENTLPMQRGSFREVKSKEPNFTLRRTFKVENTGQLPVFIKSPEISGSACEGYGFKVVNCQEFALKPNASRDIVIMFTPDFTASRIKSLSTYRSLNILTLNNMPESSMFLLVIATAYLEAQGIWEPFKRRLSVEASNPPFDLGRPFDLRRIVGISSDGNSPKPPPAQPESSTVKHSFEDSDYSSLLEAMDKDLERPESPPSPVFQEQPSSPAAQSKASCGKLEDCRPTVAKLLSNGCVQELGNSSSSEGEKDSPPPEWDFVPLHEAGSSTDSLHQISMQTMNADAFLKRPISSMSGTSSPPPPTLNFSRGSYSSIVNASSENSVKKPNGTKPKLTKSTSLPGKNGNPTFAAVAAGYDKSPGGSGPSKGSSSKRDTPGSMNIPFESDGSDSSALWSPIGNPNSPNNFAVNSFSAFGSSNSFNLTGEVFSGIGFPKPYCSPEAQQTWLGYPMPVASIWDPPASDPLPAWPPSSGSSTAPTASVLGNGSTLWSSSTPFSHSIWSTSVESGLPFSTPPPEPIGSNSAAPPSNPDMGRTYNPWSMWRPTLGRRSSEPWPNNASSAPDSRD